jgi:hypothetical protein
MRLFAQSESKWRKLREPTQSLDFLILSFRPLPMNAGLTLNLPVRSGKRAMQGKIRLPV